MQPQSQMAPAQQLAHNKQQVQILEQICEAKTLQAQALTDLHQAILEVELADPNHHLNQVTEPLKRYAGLTLPILQVELAGFQAQLTNGRAIIAQQESPILVPGMGRVMGGGGIRKI